MVIRIVAAARDGNACNFRYRMQKCEIFQGEIPNKSMAGMSATKWPTIMADTTCTPSAAVDSHALDVYRIADTQYINSTYLNPDSYGD